MDELACSEELAFLIRYRLGALTRSLRGPTFIENSVEGVRKKLGDTLVSERQQGRFYHKTGEFIGTGISESTTEGTFLKISLKRSVL